MTLLGDSLKELRGADLSLYDVQRGTGISRGLIQAYERGEKVPGPENLVKLAEFYEVPYEDIRSRYYLECFASPQELEAALKAIARLKTESI